LAAVCAPQRGLCARSVAVAEKFGAQPALVQGLNVLEVGCGCGFRHPPCPAPPTPMLSRSMPRTLTEPSRAGRGRLAGLAAAAAGAAAVTLTDGYPPSVESARRNAAAAGEHVAARCRAAQLVWGDSAAAAAAARACGGAADVVLGADVGYDPGSQAELAATLVAAAAAVQPPARVLIAQECRWRVRRAAPRPRD
jgi:predicted nicotinamide N-methyase